MADYKTYADNAGKYFYDDINGVKHDLADKFEPKVHDLASGFGTEFSGIPGFQGYQGSSAFTSVVDLYKLDNKSIFAVARGYYPTVDLTTGKQISLADLFTVGTDYITPISENIIVRMRQQMAEEPGKSYDIDGIDGEPVNVAAVLQERQAFYVNESGNVVICFDEGEVAAMYMGPLEFEIDNEVIRDIRK
jgi:hypothetical protein